VVQPTGALILGACAAVICYLAIQVKERLKYDDSLDAFGVHGVGGTVGALLLTFFIRDSWMVAAREAAKGSWTLLDQLSVQATAVGIAIAYAAIVTTILVLLVDKVFGLRADASTEMAGLDYSIHGEQGYGMLNLS